MDFLLLMGYVVEVGQVGHDKHVVGAGQDVGGELQLYRPMLLFLFPFTTKILTILSFD